MKPVRASGRASSLPPSSKNCGRKGHHTLSQEPGSSGKAMRHKTNTQPKSKVTEAYTRKIKDQETWKPLTMNSITALDNMLNLAIMSVITMKQKDKEESQRHVDILKERFLSICRQLKVPPQKRGTILQGSRLYQVEAKKAILGKQSLEVLEAEVSTVVGALEQMEGKIEALEQENRKLKAKLEEENKSQEFLQLIDQGVLHLPALPLRNGQENPLQEQMVGMVTESDVAGHLTKALQSSVKLQEMCAFLEKAHQQADGLL